VSCVKDVGVLLYKALAVVFDHWTVYILELRTILTVTQKMNAVSSFKMSVSSYKTTI